MRGIRESRSARSGCASADSHAGRWETGTPVGASGWHTRQGRRRSITPSRTSADASAARRPVSGDLMRMSLLVLAFVIAAAPFAALAASSDGAEKALRLVPKEAIASTIHSSRLSAASSSMERAPFLLNDDDPADLGLELVPHPESRRGSPSS